MPKTVSCVLCGRDDPRRDPELTRYSCNPEPYAISRCEGCGLIFQSPRPTVDELAEMYAQDPYYAADNADRGARRERFYTARWRRLEKLVPQPGNLLGIGCLEGGQALQFAQQRGWRVTGVESSEILARYAREQLGLDIRQSRGWDLSAMPKGEFDAVYSHSLEHIPNPRVTIDQAKQCLKPGGLLMIEVPNQFHSFKERIKLALLRPKFLRADTWLYLDPRCAFHVYFFTPRTLQALVQSIGFEIKALRTYLPRHPVYLSKPPRSWFQELVHLAGGPFGRGPSIELIAVRPA